LPRFKTGILKKIETGVTVALSVNIIMEVTSPRSSNGLLKLNPTVYRFKLEPLIVDQITNFAKQHQNEPRKAFQSLWIQWLRENARMVEEESSRLNDLGYRGSPVDKMYKSARYYFRTKPECDEASPRSNDGETRRRYVSSSEKLRKAMDAHIARNVNNEDYTPADGFNDFCRRHTNLLRVEVITLCSQGEIDAAAIAAKMKKTYKNRYYQKSRSK